MGVNKELWNDFVDYVTKDANENQKSLFRKELFNTVNKHQVYKEQGLDQLLFEQYLQPEQYRTEGENILADLMTRENLPHPNHVEEFWNKVGKDIKNFERKEKLTIKVILLIAGTLTLAAAGVAIGAVLVPGAAISAAITSAVTSIGMGNVIAIGASAITALSIGAGLSMHSLTKDKKKIILEQFKKSLSDEIEKTGNMISESQKNIIISYLTNDIIENSNGNKELIKNCASYIAQVNADKLEELLENTNMKESVIFFKNHEDILILEKKILEGRQKKMRLEEEQKDWSNEIATLKNDINMIKKNETLNKKDREDQIKKKNEEIDTKKRQINNSIEAHKGNEKKIKQMNKDLETKTKQILNELQKEKAEAKAAEEEKNKQKKIGEEIEEKIQLLGEEIKQQKEAKELEKAAEVRKKSEELEAKAA